MWQNREDERLHRLMKLWVGLERGREIIGIDLRSLAHDLLNDGHGRVYRGVSLLCHSLLVTNEIDVRASGLRIREVCGYEFRVSFFQTPVGEFWPIVGFLAFKHHMRRLKLRPDISAASM